MFTSEDLNEVQDAFLENKVKVPTCAGAIALIDVVIQNTGLGSEKTSFFRALSIPTKISWGTSGCKSRCLVSFTEQWLRE